MYRINDNQFYEHLNKLCDLLRYEQNREGDFSELSFKKGLALEQEGYKYDIIEEANNILKSQEWTSADIGAGKIASLIKKVYDPKRQNIVDWRDVDHLKDIIDRNLKISEKIFFDIFCNGKEERSFNEAVDLFGNKYPLISYIFFVKAPEKYVSVNPSHFKSRFDLLGISTDCLNKCTWENYTEFLEILRCVKERIKPYFSDVSLIDAHSFVWMMWMINQRQGSPGWFKLKSRTPDKDELCRDIEKRREQFLDRFSIDKLALMNGKELLNHVFSDSDSSMMNLLMFDNSYRRFGAAGQYKYLGIVYQSAEGQWFYKESSHSEKITMQEAEKRVEQVRDQLLYCVDQINKIGTFCNIEDYEKLQNRIDSVFFL